MLFYREAMRMNARQSLARLSDVNAGMAGGDAARARAAALSEGGAK